MNNIQILGGNALERLADLPAGAVQCCVTSPPYWGLRDYGLPPTLWGGEAAHAHEWGELGRAHHPGQVPDGKAVHAENAVGQNAGSGQFCACGAWLGCLGLEPTPELYVEHMVTVFREMRRVLSDDGTLWVNIGDSYANDSKWGGTTGGKHVAALHGAQVGRAKRFTGLKGKDLVGIPWMLAFALRADGWYLRSEIIWHKPNPMPESVRDRPTKAHEILFLLTKSAKYFYDAEAIKEPATNRPPGNGLSKIGAVEWRNKRSVWTIAPKPFRGAHFATFPPALVEPCILAGSRAGDAVLDPFGGSMTTGVVAALLGRDFYGIELNEKYVELGAERLLKDAGAEAIIW